MVIPCCWNASAIDTPPAAALIAAANPVYAEAAKSATLLVAACVVVTAILYDAPIALTALALRRRFTWSMVAWSR